MKQYPLVQVGDPELKVSCTPFGEAEILSVTTKEMVKRMKYTMRAVHGVGLAAPQVGIHRMLFVMRMSPSKYRPNIPHVAPYAVFNPEIVKTSGNETDWEGCFSVAKAGLFAKVSRPSSIHVRYFDEQATIVERELTGLEARIFQHEYDHLIGMVFLDRQPNPSTFMGVDEYRAMLDKEI